MVGDQAMRTLRGEIRAALAATFLHWAMRIDPEYVFDTAHTIVAMDPREPTAE